MKEKLDKRITALEAEYARLKGVIETEQQKAIGLLNKVQGMIDEAKYQRADLDNEAEGQQEEAAS